MVDIWPVYEGREPTRGEPWAPLPLDDAITLLELKPRHFISDPTRTPRFGPHDRDMSIFGYKPAERASELIAASVELGPNAECALISADPGGRGFMLLP